MGMMHGTPGVFGCSLSGPGNVFYCMLGFVQENPALSVAVKTCKNSTSDSVREKFLQEARECPAVRAVALIDCASP